MPSIRRRNSKWQVQIRLIGFPPLAKTFSSRKDAKAWGREQERRYQTAEISHLESNSHALRLQNLIDRYIAEILPEKRCGEYEETLLRALLRRNLAKLYVSTIVPADVERYRDDRLRSVGPDIVRRELFLVQNVFEVGRMRWGISLRQNPLKFVKKPSPSRARIRRVTTDETKNLTLGSVASKNLCLKPIMELALYTAMRRGELLNLRWSDLDLEKRTLHIPEAKNGTPRTIPLSSEAITTLETIPRIEERVLPTTASAISQAWRRLTKRAGIEDLHFHDLRHEAISRFFERGLSIAEVALISGHKDVRQLFRYTHLRAEDVAKKLR